VAGSTQYVSVDRWNQNAIAGPGTFTVYNSLRVEDSPNTLTRYCHAFQSQRNGANPGWLNLAQRIESVFLRPHIGEKLSLSFWQKFEKIPENGFLINIHEANVRDDWSSNTLVFQKVYSPGDLLLNQWQKFELDNDALSGLTINSDRGLEVNVYCAFDDTIDGAPFYTKTAQAKLSIGEKVQDFSLAGRDLQDEFSLCQRYYTQIRGSTIGSGYFFGTTNFIANVDFPAEMRTIPLCAGVGTISNFIVERAATSAASFSVINTLVASRTGVRVNANTPSPSQVGYGTVIGAIGDAYLEADAEL
jgi:hypothetical protein